jgi:hypothetical protein
LERPFTITVSSTGAVSPTTIPKAGVSGEHKATTLNYSLAVPQSGIYKYNIEIQSGLGESYLSEFITPSDGATRIVSFSIPSAITRMGAADFCLIETKVDALDEIISITKSAMTRCIFTASPDSLDDLETSYSGLLQGLISDVENIYDAIEELIANAGLYFNRPNFIFDTLAEALAYDGDGYIVGSAVQTRGYYEAGDNGGALYEIKAKDSPDGIFSYSINNDVMLSIVVENNEIRVDQLGAKKNAIHTEPVLTRTPPLVGDLDTLDAYFSYQAYQLELNEEAFDGNAAIIEAALKEVEKVTFTPGAVYPITNLHTTYAIDVPSGATIDGNFAFLKHISKAHYTTLRINVRSDVVIRNIGLIGTVYNYTSAAENKAIKIVNSSNVYLDRVNIYDYVEGIKTQQSSGSIIDETLCCSGIYITDCRIERVIQGWQANALINSTISNLYISCKINELLGESGYTNHCIYAGSHIRNCQFNNLVLRDAFWGSAFKRAYASTGYDASGNITISNVTVYNCQNAMYIGSRTDGVSVSNIVASHCQEGLLLGSGSNITIDNCIFSLWKEADLTTVEIDGTDYPVAYERGVRYKRYPCVEFGSGDNIKISNCTFDAHHCILYKIDANWDVSGNDENISFFNCDFHLEKVYNNVVIDGILPFAGVYISDNVVFDTCQFYVAGFGAYPLYTTSGAGKSAFVTPLTPADMVTELAAVADAHKYSCLFYFGNNTTANERDYFTSFKNCRFESAVEMNSVFCDFAKRNTLHLKVENCAVKGFRLLTRRAEANGDGLRDSSYSETKNPAYETYPADFEAHSIYMDSLDRFLATGNIYEDYSGLRPYQFAESYGISNLPVYNDIIINATNLRPGGSAPAFKEFVTGIYQISFVNANTDIVYGSFEIPHGYKEGTDLEVHIHWSPSSTNTGNCVFNFDYSVANMSTGVFGPAAQKTLTAAGSGVALQHQYSTGNTAIDGDDIKIGDVIVFALSRPAGDAFTGDAFLHSIGLHYECDTLGSRALSRK